MEDINNALLHIKEKHNGEIPYQYGSRECAKLMDSYAKEYHERKLKLLGISDVVGQSEQLCGLVGCDKTTINGTTACEDHQRFCE